MKWLLIWALGISLSSTWAQNEDKVKVNRNVKNVNVFIIGINDFDSNYWKSKTDGVLKRDILNVVGQLDDFFKSKPYTHKIHVLEDKAETTKRGLKKYLENQFDSIQPHSLVLFFFIGHGKRVMENGEINHYLITSSTPENPTINNAFSIRKDFLNTVGSYLNNCYVLSFIDACYSGQISNMNSLLKATLQQNEGNFHYMIASATKAQETYAAIFTKSLLKLWTDKTLQESDYCEVNFSSNEIDGAIRPYFESILEENSIFDKEFERNFVPTEIFPLNTSDICFESFQGLKSCMLIRNNYSTDLVITLYYKENGQTKRIKGYSLNTGRSIKYFAELDIEYLVIASDGREEIFRKTFKIQKNNPLQAIAFGEVDDENKVSKEINFELFKTGKFLSSNDSIVEDKLKNYKLSSGIEALKNGEKGLAIASNQFFENSNEIDLNNYQLKIEKNEGKWFLLQEKKVGPFKFPLRATPVAEVIEKLLWEANIEKAISLAKKVYKLSGELKYYSLVQELNYLKNASELTKLNQVYFANETDKNNEHYEKLILSNIYVRPDGTNTSLLKNELNNKELSGLLTESKNNIKNYLKIIN